MNTMINTNSILFDTDSYKVSMHLQYPPNTKHVYSHVLSRGGVWSETLFFNLQSYLKEVLSYKITQEEIDSADEFWTIHGEPFNRAGWQYILDTHNGYLPVEIRSIDEGSVVDTGTVLATIVNTDPNVPWLTTWLETPILRAIWYGTTVATQSWEIKRVIKSYLEMSGDVSGLPFKLHDFGSRGVSSNESSVLGGMSHLINFMGTDTAIGIMGAIKYYDAKLNATGFSIPAAEHSTITSWGRGAEALAYANMVNKFSKEGSIFAVVSDSYDIFNAVDNIWGKELIDLVREKKGTLVIRPDSGDPLEVLPRLLHSLEKSFGVTINTKGFKVLNNVRLIWGDGINMISIESILRTCVNLYRFSADNLAFGMGGALLQMVNRDTQKFAMKCSAIAIADDDGNIEWRDVYKDPITDRSKTSLKGRVMVIREKDKFINIPYDESMVDKDELKLRFRNGEFFNNQIFSEIRSISESFL